MGVRAGIGPSADQQPCSSQGPAVLEVPPASKFGMALPESWRHLCMGVGGHWPLGKLSHQASLDWDCSVSKEASCWEHEGTKAVKVTGQLLLPCPGSGPLLSMLPVVYSWGS